MARSAREKGGPLGVGEVEFIDHGACQTSKRVVYGVDIKRVIAANWILGIADGWLEADGKAFMKLKDMRVGLFRRTDASVA